MHLISRHWWRKFGISWTEKKYICLIFTNKLYKRKIRRLSLHSLQHAYALNCNELKFVRTPSAGKITDAFLWFSPQAFHQSFAWVEPELKLSSIVKKKRVDFWGWIVHEPNRPPRCRKSSDVNVLKKFRQTLRTMRQYVNVHALRPFSRTTRVSRYQKGKTSLDFTEARDSEWQWHQLGHVHVCTLLQTDSHASIPTLSFYKG